MQKVDHRLSSNSMGGEAIKRMVTVFPIALMVVCSVVGCQSKESSRAEVYGLQEQYRKTAEEYVKKHHPDWTANTAWNHYSKRLNKCLLLDEDLDFMGRDLSPVIVPL